MEAMSNPLIFDAHVHFFSREVIGFYARQSPELKGLPDPEAVAVERLGIEPPPAEPEALARRWAEELDRFGVQKAVLFGSAPHEQHSIGKAVRAYPDRFVGFQMVNPSVPNLQEVLEEMVTCGLKGVLLFPAMHSYYVDDQVCRPVYEAARKYRLIVFIHLGQLKIAIRDKLGISGRMEERYGDPRRLVKILRENEDLAFIVPHFGNGHLTSLLALAQGVRNLYLDTSSSNSWMQATPEYPNLESVFHTALDAPSFGLTRILFGTDSTVFPRGWRRDVFDSQLEVMNRLGLSRHEVHAILYGNLARLL